MANDNKRGLSFFAWVRSLSGGEWHDRAGKRFRQTTQAISRFATDHQVGADDLLNLGTAKLQGFAYKDYAEVIKNFGEVEKNAIEAELARRALESRVRKEEAEARQAELKVLDAELELIRKFNDIGVALQTDDQGKITLFQSTKPMNLAALRRALLAAAHDLAEAK